MKRSLFGFTLSMLVASAQASPLVVNGSFEDAPTPGSTFIYLSGLSPTININGWTTTSILTALITPANTSTLLWQPTTPSPDGGNFLATDGSFGLGTLTQTLHGLAPGHSYNLSFYQADGQLQGNDGATTDQWIVTIGGSLVPVTSVTLPDATTWSPFVTDVVTGEDYQWTTPLMPIPSHGFSGWQAESFTFVANAADELLGFLGVGAPLAVPPLVLLDGVTVTATATPEPATLALLGIGLLGVAIVRRNRQKRA